LDGRNNGSHNFNGTADANVEGLLDFDGTKDGIVITPHKKSAAVIRTFINPLKPKPPAELYPKGTCLYQNLWNRLLTHHSSQIILLSFVGAKNLLLDWKIELGDSVSD
jgi:hypothetical protein